MVTEFEEGKVYYWSDPQRDKYCIFLALETCTQLQKGEGFREIETNNNSPMYLLGDNLKWEHLFLELTDKKLLSILYGINLDTMN